jgi:cellulose synthase/poly-beta-1,6-N-acetylglucosamine synthase-like glycosyltransferase
MNEWMSGSVLALYYLVLGILALYGLHRMALVATFYRTRRLSPVEPPVPSRWPVVTVQLPIFNERYVADRLIEAVCGLDYPRDQLEIQVLDDSTDDTREIVAHQVARLQAVGFDIHHVFRDNREGFKAGALAAGLEVARGEMIAVFDADFVPGRDFLRRTVPHFADSGVGMVQARWGHLNRDYSLLTRIQAILLDGHFVVEHAARARGGCNFNFNGTAGVWRRQAIEEAGGWEHDTLTEDLDLSYRAQLRGWRFVFLSEVVAPAELPAEINAYKSQQNRWAKGSIQTCRKLLGRVIRAPIPLRARMEAVIHLTNNVAYLLMFALAILIFPAMILRRGEAEWMLLAFDLPIFLSATISVVVFFLVSQHAAGRSVWQALLFMPPLMGLGMGLAVNNSRAVISGFFRDGGVFYRTPKYSIEGKGDEWSDKSYLLGQGLSFYVEGFLTLYFIGCFAAAIYWEMWLSMPFLYLFLHGYIHIFLLGITQRLRRPRRLEVSEALVG